MAAESGGKESKNPEDQDAVVSSPFVEIEFSDIFFYERCGGGAFGSVYRALWKSQNKVVAVKKLLVLEKEAQVLSLLSHKNIIKFFGAVTVPPNFCIITEYAENGSLFAFLSQQENNSMLSFEQIINWSTEIASGMHYLHEEAPITVVHRDLKSKNVVISSEYVCKICDFGASKFLGNTTKMSVAGTLPWMAPEVIQCLPVSESCDVWSFGVVLWELLTHEVPFKGIEGFQVAWAVVEKGERLTIPSCCPPKFADLMQWCWETDANERPTFSQILKVLRMLKDDDSLYDAASVYLSQKSLWRQEIEATLDLMKRAEHDLNEKQKQLEEWEHSLQEKEENLKRQKLCMQLYEHDVNTWSVKDVYLWIKHLGTETCTQDLEQYADLFLHQHISGKRLLLLSPDDLKDMDITTVGHRIHLMAEIEKLKSHNKRMLHFPPLEQSLSHGHSTPVRPSTISLTFLFGNHIRLDSSALVHKWKMFLEVDEGESPLTAVACIKEVSFECRQAGLPLTRIAQPPFVMDRWCTGISCDTKVTCIVTYESIVKKPRFTQHVHQVTAEGSTSLQKEVVLTLQHLKGSCNNSRRNPPHCKSAPAVTNVWKNRFFPSSFSLPPENAERGTWAKIAAGEISTSPLRTRKLPHLDNFDSSSDGDSIFETVKALSLKLLEDSHEPECSSEHRRKPRRKWKKLLFSLQDSSSSESFDEDSPRPQSTRMFRERRSSAPSRRPHNHHRHKYRHSTSDTGFSSPRGMQENFSDHTPLNKRFVKIRECRFRLQSEVDHLQTSTQNTSAQKSHFKTSVDPFDLHAEDGLCDLPLRLKKHSGSSLSSRMHGRARLFGREKHEPQLRSWSLDRDAF